MQKNHIVVKKYFFIRKQLINQVDLLKKQVISKRPHIVLDFFKESIYKSKKLDIQKLFV